MTDKATIKHLAGLSRLQFSEEELERYSRDMENIFNYANLLKKIDTSKINPSAHAIPLQNVFKADEIKPYQNIEKILKNAPQVEDHSFVVPRILGD
ncbi:MAG: Asp-tRNA(Asn)/Glu-tRNA(Gln) amidotransferase subunit GatC [Candidatus Margulisbacteria bacterium]|nr:Asp-tRNA(Asn)/Glu-tRNA(Gln) amidotransferase subunit GatC [Candidatus Margulisiibacteriota bacterium]